VSLLRQPARQPRRALPVRTALAWYFIGLAISHLSIFSEGPFLSVWVGAMLRAEGRGSRASKSLATT
jgi:hypothetical protein